MRICFLFFVFFLGVIWGLEVHNQYNSQIIRIKKKEKKKSSPIEHEFHLLFGASIPLLTLVRKAQQANKGPSFENSASNTLSATFFFFFSTSRTAHLWTMVCWGLGEVQRAHGDYWLWVMATYGYICDYIRHRWLI